uniref:hypothetical protein n=1 Tax=Psychrobacter sp. TaxID=56811 RepID=UPI00159B22C8|nr:hypothetical protein [Psychrobacter sp.]QJS05801.1 hypothetical protein [Psychrobacter sp.]
MSETILVGNKKYTLTEFHGEVVDQQVSETSYRSNTSYINEHDQAVSRTSSGTHTTKEFFLVNQQGEERAYSFTNAPVPSIRPGHIAQVMIVNRQGTKNSHYVFVRNATLNAEYLDSGAIGKLCSTPENIVLGLVATAIIVFSGVFCFWRLFTFFFLDAGFSSLLPIIIAVPIGYFAFKFIGNGLAKHSQQLKDEIFSRRV